ncbi:MAG: DUF1415 domain-containing protein [Gemmata sp.]
MNAETVIDHTRRWVSDVVIGLNLCPFARRVFDGGLIRFLVTGATTTEELREALKVELQALAGTPAEEVETVILIHPRVLTDFLDYNDFLAEADALLAELDLGGVIQIASFHPRYQFAGTKPDDIGNCTNRSPFPLLHLLRESSVSAVNGDPEKLGDIPKRNVETLRKLGRAGLLALLNPPTS